MGQAFERVHRFSPVSATLRTLATHLHRNCVVMKRENRQPGKLRTALWSTYF